MKNFDENEQFWEKYHTPIDTAFEIFYDNFLKANQQQDGLESYSKFVGLMIGYEKVGLVKVILSSCINQPYFQLSSLKKIH